jgi:dihydrofolate reductase
MNFKIIVAVDKDYGIGFENKLPWHFKSDMNFFKNITIGDGKNAVVMGKNTYLSIGRQLPKRDNLILSSSLEDKTLKIFSNIDLLLDYCKLNYYDSIWIIGGESIYKQFLEKKLVNIIHLTEINNSYTCDTFFNKENLDEFTLSKNESSIIEDDVMITFKKFYKKIH